MAKMRLVLPCSIWLLSIILPATVAAEKPFNFENTAGKLPKQVVPTEYSIRIIPNIEKLTFSGSETVKLNVHAPVRELVLNALELEIPSASVDDKILPQSAVKIDKRNELLTLTLPSELAPGHHTLPLSFSGKINQHGHALFYIPHQDHPTAPPTLTLGSHLATTKPP